MKITRSATNPNNYKIEGHPYWYQRGGGNQLLDAILDSFHVKYGIQPGFTADVTIELVDEREEG